MWNNGSWDQENRHGIQQQKQEQSVNTVEDFKHFVCTKWPFNACNDIDTYPSCLSNCHKTWCKTKVLRQAVISSVLAIKITVFYWRLSNLVRAMLEELRYFIWLCQQGNELFTVATFYGATTHMEIFCLMSITFLFLTLSFSLFTPLPLMWRWALLRNDKISFLLLKHNGMVFLCRYFQNWTNVATDKL